MVDMQRWNANLKKQIEDVYGKDTYEPAINAVAQQAAAAQAQGRQISLDALAQAVNDTARELAQQWHEAQLALPGVERQDRARRAQTRAARQLADYNQPGQMGTGFGSSKLYQGSKGGRFYINKFGNKTYVKAYDIFNDFNGLN